jgi:site-specific DNA recombinase
MAKTIGYLRVSTDGQVEGGYGLDSQRERIESYAKVYDLHIDEFVVDDGYTGTTLDRPGIKRIMAMCASGEASKVIVYKIDRLSRSQRRLLELIEDHFTANNVSFVSVMEQFDTSTAFGRACIGILGVFSQLDRDTLIERMSNGRKTKASKGERASGQVPYGYVVIDGHTIINDAQASIVRRIFALRQAGATMQSICNDLHREGVATPKGGSTWYPSAIKTIIDNPIYRGVVEYNAGGGATPIVSENERFALL